MSQRFEEDFNELGLIYEAFASSTIPTKAGGQIDLVQGSPSYPKRFMQPGGRNRFAQQDLNTHATIASPIDEETSPLLDKINALIKEADDNGENYALHQLTSLKAFIVKQGQSSE